VTFPNAGPANGTVATIQQIDRCSGERGHHRSRHNRRVEPGPPTTSLFVRGARLSALGGLFMVAVAVIDEVMDYGVLPRWLTVGTIALSVLAAVGNLILARVSRRSKHFANSAYGTTRTRSGVNPEHWPRSRSDESPHNRRVVRKAFAATAAAIVIGAFLAVEILLVALVQRLIEHDGRYSLVFAGALAVVAVAVPLAVGLVLTRRERKPATPGK
jgi:hypothetical protein